MRASGAQGLLHVSGASNGTRLLDLSNFRFAAMN
jgi:hypothetical protein